jgi:hypothetical protein
MPANLIVTCGTSQIELEKIDLINKKSLLNKRLKYSDFDRSEGKVSKTDFDNYRQNNPAVETICAALKSSWPPLRSPSDKPKDNPFGAELSTLALMKAANVWSSEEDSISLIASDTRAGVICAAIIARFLEQAVGVRADQTIPVCGSNTRPPAKSKQTGLICFSIAAGVKETTDSPGDAQRSLAQCAVNALDEHGHNRLVITGGFKSMLPAMTVTAFVFGLRLFYLFEDARQLTELNLSYNLQQDDVKRFWKDTWLNMKKKGFASDSPLMQELLEGRRQNPDVYYGG